MREFFDIKENCCGCELCAQSCPVSIIKMEQDDEGFFYPRMTDESRCINCNKCVKVCPEKSRVVEPRKVLSYYSGFAKDESIIKNCASGGIATVISQEIIKEGGIVYGIEYSSDFATIQYGRTTTLDGINKFRGSKYAQSRKTDVFNKILTDLKAGIKILYIGLPCDIAAVYNHTRDRFDNLYTIELVCHGVTSPKVQSQFVEKDSKQRGSRLKDFSVRYKKNGWKPYYIHECFEDGKEIIKPFRPTAYGIAFHYLKRPSCNFCKFKINDKNVGLQADLTIGDNHGVGKSSLSFHSWGSSMALVHTAKGQELIDSIKNSFVINLDDDHLVSSNLAIYRPFPIKPNRAEFATEFAAKDIFAACNLASVRKAEFRMKAISVFTSNLIRICTHLGIEKLRRKCTKQLKSVFRK